MSNILYDLSFGHVSMGFSGIPQDTRLLFSGLSEEPTLTVSGMIRNHAASFLSNVSLDSILGQSTFLGDYLNHRFDQSSKLSRINKLRFLENKHQINKLYRYIKNNKNLKLYAVENELFFDTIWRSFFHSTLIPEKRSCLKNSQFYLCPFGNDAVHLISGRDKAAKSKISPSINTKEFDFFMTQDSKYFKLSPNTTRIVRYHDGIPVYMPDTFNNYHNAKIHLTQIKACQQDSIYVCNSTSALEDLEKISPIAAEKARVIPYFLPVMQKVNNDPKTFLDIVRKRMALDTIKAGDEEKLISKWFNLDKSGLKVPKFIMTLSTLEPRKNHIGLIQAWQKLRMKTGEDIKLLIAGSPGWEYDKILRAMSPFTNNGDILHISKIAQDEMPYIYSAASCFVFPSFGEGFGLPPSEAMQCDCPVAISDIAAHRYSAGDAALYFDPYDTEDMAKKIQQILEQQSLQQELIQKGHVNFMRYSEASVLPQWKALFEELSKNKSIKGKSHD